MIVLAVGCDVPRCAFQVSRPGVGLRHMRDQAVDLLAVAARWIDDLGRAWCPVHRAKEPAA